MSALSHSPHRFFPPAVKYSVFSQTIQTTQQPAAWYADAVRDLQSTYKTPRSLPQWGREIFSDVCVAVRPTSPEEVASFITYAAALTRLHMQVAKLQQPMLVARGPRLKEIHACHKRFCDMQLKNDKTKRVLEAAFSAEFADSYMKEVMFDVV